MILDCDWSISMHLIPNRSAKNCNSAKICNNSAKICNNSAKICNNSAKICNNSAKICNNSAKSVKTVQNSVINLSACLTLIPTKYNFFAVLNSLIETTGN